MLQRRTWMIAALASVALSVAAQTGRIGVVVMHGKGGRPDGLVTELASGLAARGMLVRNLEMPWSGRRGYDVAPEAAEAEVTQALEDLQRAGATRLFLVGHSQGGLYALHLGARLPLAGVVAVAPGGNVAASVYEQHIGAQRARARELVAAGRGAEVQVFADYEGSKGTNEVRTRADVYWAWFDPLGVMNQERALRALPAQLPVLYVAPTGDYPALRRANPGLFAILPPQPLTRYLQPDASHTRVPTVAREAIAGWLIEAAAAR
ncbi:alpha/beta hydrolase [Curvibacter sp. PAE-UM]|uniref:alpha/beta hydrolase n=1 Tax=Curvibacter sp. PAE-UM TaxID=1714344 RepID=UPI000B00A620|nr:alpha/beta hydrolase [Curvibacter sp. PAE-UM]